MKVEDIKELIKLGDDGEHHAAIRHYLKAIAETQLLILERLAPQQQAIIKVKPEIKFPKKPYKGR